LLLLWGSGFLFFFSFFGHPKQVAVSAAVNVDAGSGRGGAATWRRLYSAFLSQIAFNSCRVNNTTKSGKAKKTALSVSLALSRAGVLLLGNATAKENA